MERQREPSLIASAPSTPAVLHGSPSFQLRVAEPRREGAGEITHRRISPKVYLNPALVWELLDQRNTSQNKLALLSGISPGNLKANIHG